MRKREWSREAEKEREGTDRQILVVYQRANSSL